MSRKERVLAAIVVGGLLLAAPAIVSALPVRSFATGDAILAADFQLLWDTVDGLEQRAEPAGFCFNSAGTVDTASVRGRTSVLGARTGTGQYEFNSVPPLTDTAPCVCQRHTAALDTTIVSVHFSAGSTLNVHGSTPAGSAVDLAGCCVCVP